MPAKKKKTRKSDFSLKVILTAIVVASTILIFFSSTNNYESPQVVTPSQNLPSSIIVYPGSSTGIVTENDQQITYNYRAPEGVLYTDIINFYKQEMVKNGWKLTNFDDTQALFEKGKEKVRVWILYLNVAPGDVVEYIIDYTN